VKITGLVVAESVVRVTATEVGFPAPVPGWLGTVTSQVVRTGQLTPASADPNRTMISPLLLKRFRPVSVTC